MGIKLFLRNVRLSYPRLGAPDYYQGKKQRDNDVRRWDASFIVGPGDLANENDHRGPQGTAFDIIAKTIDKLALDLMQDEKKAKQWKLVVLTDPKACAWTDGARKEMDGVFILASHRREPDGRPLVLDADGSSIYKRVQTGVDGAGKPVYKTTNDIVEGKEGRLYAGCFVNAHVELWAQKGTTPGLRCNLLGVQYASEGESFGGGARGTAEDFGVTEVEDGATADDLG